MLGDRNRTGDTRIFNPKFGADFRDSWAMYAAHVPSRVRSASTMALWTSARANRCE